MGGRQENSERDTLGRAEIKWKLDITVVGNTLCKRPYRRTRKRSECGATWRRSSVDRWTFSLTSWVRVIVLPSRLPLYSPTIEP